MSSYEGRGCIIKVAATQTTVHLLVIVEETTESKLDKENGWLIKEESNETWSGGREQAGSGDESEWRIFVVRLRLPEEVLRLRGGCSLGFREVGAFWGDAFCPLGCVKGVL